MMTNLLAVLVSLAMMLTGAGATMAEPASRTMTISDLTVQHNDEEVALTPYASLGVMTDGTKALFDFFIGGGDDATYLTFQVSVDDSGVLLTNDNANVAVKIGRDQLEEMLGDSFSADEEGLEVLGLVGDYISAYGDLIKLMGDPEASQAIQARADAIYDELVDRGAGVAGTMEYDDEIYDVTTYEYDLDAVQLGALADAVYASDEKLANFAEVYFRLMQAMPEDSGLKGMESFEALMAQFGNVSLHVIESIADTGLNVSDIILHIAVPGLDAPLEFTIHTVKDGESQTAEMNGDFAAEDTELSLSMESALSGGDMQFNITLTVNPAGEAEEADVIGGDDGPTAIYVLNDEDEADDEDDEDIDDVDDIEDIMDLVDGEGDIEDAYYFTMDFDRDYDEDTGAVEESLAYAFDAAAQDIHADLTVNGSRADDGEGDYQISGGMDIADDAYGFSFNVAISDEEIDARCEDVEPVSLEDFDSTALVASVGADAMNLYADESVQKLIAMAQSAMEAAEDSGADELLEDVVEDIEDIEDIDDADAAPAEMTFGNPQFNWLPEGYEVDYLNVDEEYQDVNGALVNEATGDSVFFDITNSYIGTDVNHFSLNADGSYTAIDVPILNQEVGDGYTLYSLDDGTLAFSIFPSTDALGIEDIVHILSELTF